MEQKRERCREKASRWGLQCHEPACALLSRLRLPSLGSPVPCTLGKAGHRGDPAVKLWQRFSPASPPWGPDEVGVERPNKPVAAMGVVRVSRALA